MIAGVSDADQPEPGVLGSLPKTRPQRASARRTAARSPAKKDTPRAEAEKPKAPKAKAKRSPRKPKTPAEPPRPVAPRQGFEADGDFATGPVEPPSGTDIAGSVVDLLGELAQSGLSSGGRLVKDALTRLLGS